MSRVRCKRRCYALKQRCSRMVRIMRLGSYLANCIRSLIKTTRLFLHSRRPMRRTLTISIVFWHWESALQMSWQKKMPSATCTSGSSITQTTRKSPMCRPVPTLTSFKSRTPLKQLISRTQQTRKSYSPLASSCSFRETLKKQSSTSRML